MLHHIFIILFAIYQVHNSLTARRKRHVSLKRPLKVLFLRFLHLCKKIYWHTFINVNSVSSSSSSYRRFWKEIVIKSSNWCWNKDTSVSDFSQVEMRPTFNQQAFQLFVFVLKSLHCTDLTEWISALLGFSFENNYCSTACYACRVNLGL